MVDGKEECKDVWMAAAALYSIGHHVVRDIKHSSAERGSGSDRCVSQRVCGSRPRFFGGKFLPLCICSELSKCSEYDHEPDYYPRCSHRLGCAGVQLSLQPHPEYF